MGIAECVKTAVLKPFNTFNKLTVSTDTLRLCEI
jgi:hypothetical protein